jgi:hypothetical protein
MPQKTFFFSIFQTFVLFDILLQFSETYSLNVTHAHAEPTPLQNSNVDVCVPHRSINQACNLTVIFQRLYLDSSVFMTPVLLGSRGSLNMLINTKLQYF